MKYDLKTLRRRYGLSQIQLAELVGVEQGTISRWERGKEEISRARMLECTDVFLNKNGRRTKMLENLIRQHPNVTITDHEQRFVHISPKHPISRHLNINDVIGRQYGEVADESWKHLLFANVDPGNLSMWDVTHDLSCRGDFSHVQNVCIRSKSYCLELEDHGAIDLHFVDLGKPLGNLPKLANIVLLSDLDI